VPWNSDRRASSSSARMSLRSLCQPSFAPPWEEHLSGKERALVVVRVEQPHGDLALPRRRAHPSRVEVVEAVDLDLVEPVLALANLDVGLAHEPEALVGGAAFLRSS